MVFEQIDLVEIVNINGQVVARATEKTPLAMVNVGQLTKGIYIVKVVSNGKEYFRKVVKN